MLLLKCTSWSPATFKILPHFHFSFTVPSSITQITQDQNITEGVNVTLSCQVSGVPAPTVSWIKPDGQRHNEKTLQVTHINRTQAGEYKCEARNECGNATNTATIDVQCKCMQKLSFIACCSLYFFVSISVCQYIDLLLCNFFAGEACLFLASVSAR